MNCSGSIETEFGNQRFVLLPDRAVWWPTERTLIVADVHLGKGTAFRAAGLPVPRGASVKDLSRLSALLEQTSAEKLLILGDLIHARRSRQENLHDAIVDWRGRHPSVEMLLVRGNHDRSAGRVEPLWAIHEVAEPYTVQGIQFIHAPPEPVERPTMAGHIHPVFGMTDYDQSSVTVDCFVIGKDLAVLPAFGTFTGGCRVWGNVNTKLYIATGTRVVGMR